MTTESPARHTRRTTRLVVAAALLAGGGCLVGGAAYAGTAGALAAAIGIVVVIAFFGATFLLLGPLTRPATSGSILVALMLYATKLTMLAAAAVALSQSGLLGDTVDSQVLGVTIIVCTLVAVALEVLLEMTARRPLYDLGAHPHLGESR